MPEDFDGDTTRDTARRDTARDAEEPEVIIGSREQVLHLLAEAAEIEHTLMCSYLYAAFSLKRAGAGLSAEQEQAVERWRRSIMDVAIQEMGHLLTVANLTVAVGGRPHFGRPNFPVANGYFPSDVVVRLTPFSPETIEHFVFLERPKGFGGTDDAAFQEKPYVREQAAPGLMPSAQDYATISHLYDAIGENLRALSGRIGEAGLFLGGAQAQLAGGLFGMKEITPITDLAEAERAIDRVVEQGEGSPADREDSHYRAFLAIAEEMERMLAADPGFEPAWPVAPNPVLRRPPEPEDKVWIDAVPAAALLDFACAAYGLLLRFLVQCFGRSGPRAAAQQNVLASTAFALMHTLGEASGRLAQLPASPDAPGTNAGMSFTMLRGVEPLLAGSEEKLLREQLMHLAQAARAFNLRCGAQLSQAAGKFRLDE